MKEKGQMQRYSWCATVEVVIGKGGCNFRWPMPRACCPLLVENLRTGKLRNFNKRPIVWGFVSLQSHGVQSVVTVDTGSWCMGVWER